MAAYDGTIRINTSMDSGGFNTGLNKIMGGLKGLAAAVGLAFSVGAIIEFGKSAVGAASNVEEMRNKFLAVFKSMSGGVEQQLTQMADSTNRSKYDLMEYAATMQGTFVPLGFARSQAATMSVAAVQLANDLGSFHNLDTGAVLRDIQGALVGQTETVRKYGVSLNETVIGQKAMAMGMWNGVGAISAQARAAAVMQLIMSATTDAQGDAARTSGSYANTVRGLAAAWLDFKVAVGNAIIPVLMPIIGWLKTVIVWMTALATTFAQVMSILTGQQVQTGAGLGAVADSGQAAADAQGKLADNTTKAGKAAKGALAAFDQLNVLQQADNSGGGSTPAPGGVPALPAGGDLPAMNNPISPQLIAQVESFKGKLLGLLQPAIDAFGRLQKALEPLGETIWSGLKWAWDNILVPLGTWVITNALPVFLDLLAAGARVVNSALKALAPLGQWLFDNFLKPAAAWTGQALLDFLTWLTARLNDLSKWIDANPKTFSNIVASVASGVLILIVVIGTMVQNWIKGWELIRQKASEVWAWIVQKWSEAGPWFNKNVTEPVAKWFKTAWENIKQWTLAAWNWVVSTWVGANTWITNTVTTPISTAFSSLWTNVKQWISDAWNLVVSTWVGANTWITNTVTTPISTAFSGLWNDIAAWAKTAWGNVQTSWNGVKDWFDTNVTGKISTVFTTLSGTLSTEATTAWTNVKNAWTGVETWFSDNVTKKIGDLFTNSTTGLWAGISGGITNISKNFHDTFIGADGTGGIKGMIYTAIKKIIDFLNTMIGGIATGVNAVITGLNSISIDVPWWVPGFGGNKWGFSLSTVSASTIPYPRLATGAVIPPNAQFLALLGDQRNGRNIEAPEGLIRQIMHEEIGKMQADIRIEFGGSMGALVREMKPHIDRETTRIGKSLINVKGSAV